MAAGAVRSVKWQGGAGLLYVFYDGNGRVVEARFFE
jgi:hypothetical protein